MRYEHVFEMVSERQFLALPNLLPGRDVHLKLDGLNPAGSIKLKAAVAMVREAERSGRLLPRARLIESSSGSLGVSLAMIAAARGYDFTCVVDPNITPSAVASIRAFGGRTHMVEHADASGGYLGARLNAVCEHIAADPGLVWLDQYTSAANPAAHASGTAAAILAEFETVDHLFLGVGTAGTLRGCAEHFRRYSPHTRIVAVDSQGSVTFGQPASPRRLPGLGASVAPPLFEPAQTDRQLLVSERDAIVTCRLLARRYGYLAGASTGAILAALLLEADQIPAGSVVVALSPDAGDRYLSTVYDDVWVESFYGREALDAAQRAGTDATAVVH